VDCHDAQRIISEALDGEQFAPATVREAKEHCAGCPACLGYVKTLAVAHRAPVPQPPADLADRVMARVRKEADEIAVKQAYAAAAAAVAAEDARAEAVAGTGTEGGPSAAQPLPENAPVNVKALWAQLKRPENRRTVLIWAGAAAMLLVFVGVVGIAGVNAILGGGGETARSASKQTAAYDSATQESAPQVATPDKSRDSSSTTLGSGTGAPVPSANYIVAAGSVYRLVGPNTYARSNLTTGGTTTSSLASQDPPKSLAYYLAPEKNKVVLDDGTGNLLVFQLVTRDFAGRQFVLRSGDLTSYRDWPTMPPPMQPPANPDGAPQFQPAGTSMGVPAFVQSGTTAEAGIAIGPNTPATDPAGGNPNWTWWTPLK
jgi:predicted anti-sigma-YlaC factor YlaD